MWQEKEKHAQLNNIQTIPCHECGFLKKMFFEAILHTDEALEVMQIEILVVIFARTYYNKTL